MTIVLQNWTGSISLTNKQSKGKYFLRPTFLEQLNSHSWCVESAVNPLEEHFVSFRGSVHRIPKLLAADMLRILWVFSYQVLKLFANPGRRNSLYSMNLDGAKLLLTEAGPFSLGCRTFYSQPPLLIFITNHLHSAWLCLCLLILHIFNNSHGF